MANSSTDRMRAQMCGKAGCVAALDQSGGSTPGALRTYGIPEDAYRVEADMLQHMRELRVRIMTAPSFAGDKVIGTILFERTMNDFVNGKPVPSHLWEDRGIVPFVKVDKGLELECNGVRLMKQIDGLDDLLMRAKRLGVYGTKMRSVINLQSPEGVASIVRQQFEVAERIVRRGLVPIIEPEIAIGSPDKKAAETRLLEELARALDTLPPERRVILKLTIPDQPDLYAPLVSDSHVERVIALSGGYKRDEACRRLSAHHGLIASFSRALIEDLKVSMTDHEFDETLARSLDEIYKASVYKH